jgi:hypothetical protein
VPVPILSATKFESFFRAVASLNVDGQDFKRYHDFVSGKVHDLLIRGQATAKANGRDIIEPHDLPITKGLQQQIWEFERLSEQLGLNLMLDNFTPRPQIDATLSVETDAELPNVVGAISIALARSFKIVDPTLKNPQTEQWDRALRLFDLLL